MNQPVRKLFVGAPPISGGRDRPARVSSLANPHGKTHICSIVVIFPARAFCGENRGQRDRTSPCSTRPRTVARRAHQYAINVQLCPTLRPTPHWIGVRIQGLPWPASGPWNIRTSWL